MRPVPDAATDFVAVHEELRLESYTDPGGAWTAGYGHCGPEVHAGLRITADQARSWLEADLKTASARLAVVVGDPVIRDLTDNQYAALLSFVFNLGADPNWTIWKRLNARQFDQVPVEMMRFVYCGKTKLQGLVNRRAAEVALWSTAEPGSAPDAPPSSYTRAEPTPPVTAQPVSLTRQPAFLGVAVAVALGAPEMVSRASDALTPYATVPAVHHALGLLAALAPFAAAASAAVLALQNAQAKR